MYARVRFKAEGKSFYIGDEIAYNQLFIFDEEYAVFYIDKSEIVGEVVDDNVGELISPFQHIIRQDCIKPAGYLIRKRELYT